MEKEKQGCHVIGMPSMLQAYVERTLPVAAQELIKGHLDGCPTCHDLWNRYRWDRAKSSPGYQEWLAYLEAQGEPLHEYLDSSRALIAEWQAQCPQTKEEREQFFRSTPHYLSNLLIWHESGHRPPYVAKALPWLRQLHARVICDFGCGIGSDGLRFLEAGYRVLFCEFDNPASRFLRWRLRLRQHHARWLDPADLGCADPFDTFWAMDVFDHLPDPEAILPFLEHCQILCYERNGQQHAHGGPSFHIHHAPERLHTLWTRADFRRVEADSLLELWTKG